MHAPGCTADGAVEQQRMAAAIRLRRAQASPERRRDALLMLSTLTRDVLHVAGTVRRYASYCIGVVSGTRAGGVLIFAWFCAVTILGPSTVPPEVV